MRDIRNIREKLRIRGLLGNGKNGDIGKMEKPRISGMQGLCDKLRIWGLMGNIRNTRDIGYYGKMGNIGNTGNMGRIKGLGNIGNVEQARI